MKILAVIYNVSKIKNMFLKLVNHPIYVSSHVMRI